MPNPIRLILALHNHQPIGNFDHVFQQAFDDSYRPFLDVFSRYPVAEDRAAHQRLADGMAGRPSSGVCGPAGAVGRRRAGSRSWAGPFYEPILAMIPSRDRIGQIRGYSRWLQNRLGATIRGMWVPERVWEQSLRPRPGRRRHRIYAFWTTSTSRAAGLTESQLTGHLSDRGRGPAAVGLPRQRAAALPDSLRRRRKRRSTTWARWPSEQPNAVVVFGDDGEKFGTWPETKKHVYDDGWLVRFFDALAHNQSGSR